MSRPCKRSLGEARTSDTKVIATDKTNTQNLDAEIEIANICNKTGASDIKDEEGTLVESVHEQTGYIGELLVFKDIARAIKTRGFIVESIAVVHGGGVGRLDIQLYPVGRDTGTSTCCCFMFKLNIIRGDFAFPFNVSLRLNILGSDESMHLPLKFPLRFENSSIAAEHIYSFTKSLNVVQLRERLTSDTLFITAVFEPM